jgi:RNA polymerase sigma-70 factor, ECF subfamily
MTGELYVQERPRLLRLALRILRNEALSEDAVDMAFGRALTAYEKDKPENVAAWLSAITKNVCFHILRDDKVRSGKSFEVERSMRPSTGSPHAKELVAQVDAALLQLTDRQRLALELFHFQELDHQEVAEIMDIGPGAVRALVHRAKRRLFLMLHDWAEAS